MRTIVVQIGNTDNKLTQQEWAEFYCQVDLTLLAFSVTPYFSGGSAPTAPWQNYCWVFGCNSLDDLRSRLSLLAERFHQDSIALTLGDTQFITPSKG